MEINIMKLENRDSRGDGRKAGKKGEELGKR
jgi:hypothetical protein